MRCRLSGPELVEDGGARELHLFNAYQAALSDIYVQHRENARVRGRQQEILGAALALQPRRKRLILVLRKHI
jgi:hypothetical protein